MKPLIAALLLLACGPRRIAAFEPEGGCGDGIWLEDSGRDCGCIRTQVRLARERTGLSGLEDVKIYVSAKSYHIEHGANTAGATWDADEFVTERYLRSSTHEFFHIYELRTGVSQYVTAEHTGWEARGWMHLSELGWNQTEICR